MDSHTYSGNPSGTVLARILTELPEKVGRRARSRVTTALEDAHLAVKSLMSLPDRRTARHLLLLFRRESLDAAAASNLPTNVRTHLCCVLTGIFRDAAQRMQSPSRKRARVKAIYLGPISDNRP